MKTKEFNEMAERQEKLLLDSLDYLEGRAVSTAVARRNGGDVDDLLVNLDSVIEAAREAIHDAKMTKILGSVELER